MPTITYPKDKTSATAIIRDADVITVSQTVKQGSTTTTKK